MVWNNSTHSNRTFLSKLALLLLAITVLIFAVAYQKDSLAKPQIDQTSRWQTINVNSHVTSTKTPTWKWRQVKLPGQKKLIAVNFFDEKVGVVVSSEGVIFKTENGGETWTQSKVAIPEGTHISSASYINSKLGWLGLGGGLYWKGKVLTKPIPLALHTNNAGASWSTSFTGEEQTSYKVQFVDEQAGWLTGRGVFHTTDQGNHWVKVAVPNEGKDSVYQLYAIDPEKALALTGDGRVLSTEDAGKNWQQISTLKMPPKDYYDILKIGATANSSYWVIAGVDSREGMWGQLAHLEKNFSWIKHEISAVNFRDVFYVTENEVLACGSYMADPKDFGYWDKRDGVILRSLNGGRDWNFVYRNPEVQSINAFAVLSQDSIWAVGNNGSVVKLLSK